jgi:hypothetical protein
MSPHARRRVVAVIPDRAWLAWMDDLWIRFHGLHRSPAATAADAVAALEEMGVPVRRDDVAVRSSDGFVLREEAVAEVRRRLCLTPDRDAELADALGDRLRVQDGLWVAGPREPSVGVTLHWDRAEA